MINVSDVFWSGQKTFSASQILFATGCTKNDYKHPLWTNRIRIQKKSEHLLLENKHLQPPFKISQPTHIPPKKNEKVSDPFRSLVELQPEGNGLRLRRSRSVALSAIATPPRTTTQSQRCPRRPAELLGLATMITLNLGTSNSRARKFDIHGLLLVLPRPSYCIM